MNDDPLDRALQSLTRDIVPPRNLWPGISARIGRVAPRGPSYLMAACVTLAAAGFASTFTWAMLRHGTGEAALPTVVHAGPFTEPRDPRYIAAKDELERTFQERLGLLAPATRAQIEASLMVIRDAHEKIRKALLEDPSSSVLEALWQSTWRDEIDLYDHVVQITDSTLMRS
jgi:hypothetical protein